MKEIWNLVLPAKGTLCICWLIVITPFLLMLLGRLCFSDEGTLNRIRGELVALEESDGFPPNDVDMFTLSFQGDRELTETEFSYIADFVLSRQSPSVSLDLLSSIIGAKSRSITSFRSEFTTKQVTLGRNSSETLDENFLYAFCKSNNWHLIDSTVLDNPQKREVNSYNGENFFRLVHTDDGTPNLVIQERGQISSFFIPFAPLQQSMLFDTKLISMPLAWYDFLYFVETRSPYVFEKVETVDGRECILVSTFSMRVYLDPGMDFAVTKIESFEPRFRMGINNSSFTFSGMDLTARRVLKNFRDYGNGVWLPTDIENEYYTNGNITRRELIQIKSLEINPKLDKDFFTNIAPDDAFVIDATRGLVYKQSDSPSINALLQATVKSKRSFFFQYLSVTVGILLIVLYFILKYLEYIKRKKASV